MGETYIRTREDMVREYRGEKRRKTERPAKSYFPIRLAIAALLFLFFAAEELPFSYKEFDKEQMIGEITRNENLSLWPEEIISVFQNLN